jgi:hypothetical protein
MSSTRDALAEIKQLWAVIEGMFRTQQMFVDFKRRRDRARVKRAADVVKRTAAIAKSPNGPMVALMEQAPFTSRIYPRRPSHTQVSHLGPCAP